LFRISIKQGLYAWLIDTPIEHLKILLFCLVLASMSFPGSGAASIEDIAYAKILELRNSILNHLPAKTGRRVPSAAKSNTRTASIKSTKKTKRREDPEIVTEARTHTETRSSAKKWFTDIATKMMFVSGETAEPSPETTTLIEEITRQQVIEIVSTGVLV
jgi:hypothetical protein